MVGNAFEIFGTAIAIYLILAAADVNGVLFRFLLYLVSWGCLVFFPHCLAHFVTGRLVGVRFTHYSLGRSGITKLRMPIVTPIASALPILTLKIDQDSMRAVRHGGRAVMFASGAVCSMILPFFSAAASFGRIPIIFTIALFLMSVANVLFDLYYSPRAGDISRIKPNR